MVQLGWKWSGRELTNNTVRVKIAQGVDNQMIHPHGDHRRNPQAVVPELIHPGKDRQMTHRPKVLRMTRPGRTAR